MVDIRYNYYVYNVQKLISSVTWCKRLSVLTFSKYLQYYITKKQGKVIRKNISKTHLISIANSPTQNKNTEISGIEFKETHQKPIQATHNTIKN